MNTLKAVEKHDIDQAAGRVLAVRRELAKLADFGWKPGKASQPLKDFDAMRAALAKISAEIDELAPSQTPAHERQLGQLLSRQRYLIETLESLAGSAEEALAWEQRQFFEARDKLLEPFRARVLNADALAQEAIESLAGAFQDRWDAMQKEYETRLYLFVISEKHQTSPRLIEGERRLPKPFKKVPVNGFRALVEIYLSRVAEILANGEAADPADLARQVFEK